MLEWVTVACWGSDYKGADTLTAENVAFGGIGPGGVPTGKSLWATVEMTPAMLAAALAGARAAGVGAKALLVRGAVAEASSCSWVEVRHCLPLLATACHCLPLLATACHCLCLLSVSLLPTHTRCRWPQGPRVIVSLWPSDHFSVVTDLGYGSARPARLQQQVPHPTAQLLLLRSEACRPCRQPARPARFTA